MYKNIIDLLDAIKERPGMFIGTRSITRLSSFLHGIRIAFRIVNQSFGCSVLNDFEEYIEIKYSSKRSVSWNEIFLESTDNDEVKAFELFFYEFEIFMQERGVAKG